MFSNDLLLEAINYSFSFASVQGTDEQGFLFGTPDAKLNVTIPDFFISKFLVTQRLWEFIMGNNPSATKGDELPVDQVSFHDLINPGGFFELLNRYYDTQGNKDRIKYRLPSETEWEYAARGGVLWTDNFDYSGGNDLFELGWFENNAGPIVEPSLLKHLRNTEKGTYPHAVGLKKPNQLELFDMSGNLWEWCADCYHPDTSLIPLNGSACLVESDEHVLRGGCHHNGAIHCRVDKRYAIGAQFMDNCIGFRIAFSA